MTAAESPNQVAPSAVKGARGCANRVAALSAASRRLRSIRSEDFAESVGQRVRLLGSLGHAGDDQGCGGCHLRIEHHFKKERVRL